MHFFVILNSMIHSTLTFGIVFLIASVFFCAAAFFIGRPESVKKASLCRQASFIFYLIGAVTFACGILFISLRNYLTKTAVQAIALIYLFLLIIIIFVFINMMGTKK